METSLACFVKSFLECVMEEPPTQSHIDMLMAVTRKADFERLTKGDFVIPLNSPKLKQVADPATPFGRLLLNPTEENIKVVERVLGACKLPVANIVVQNNVLRIHLDRVKVMKTFIPRIAKAGMKYGASKLLQQVPVIVSHLMKQDTSASLKNMRGLKLANHMTRILEFCGAEVNPNKSSVTVSGKPEDFTMVEHDDCDPEAACPVTIEPPDRPLQQSTCGVTPAASSHYFVEDERQSGMGFAGCRLDADSRQTKQHVETDSDTQFDGHDEIWGAASEAYVMHAPLMENTEMETQNPYSCVSERFKLLPERAERTETQREEHTLPTTQGASDEQKNIVVPEMKLVSEKTELPVNDERTEGQREEHASSTQGAIDEQNTLDSVMKFMITDSMKGVEEGPCVYQYGSVVDANTGNLWTGSVKDYCRILVEELKRTSEMKQRDVDDPEWMAFLEEQAQRCLTLQLLSATHSKQLRVEVEGVTHNTKESSFMLYNYARLCSIFYHFELCVKQGDVLPLPPVEDVDFSLLRNDEEWDLVWLFLLRWPDVVEEMALGVLGRSKKVKTAFVSRFLYSLSHRWSEYYCRYHVLSEGFLPHLLPLMYARLHLLHALSTLMRICFAILGVDSLPSHM